ncbi:MAG: hypothetical protein DIU62_006580 [Pseudomonadota bacterium]|jgi:hypothetical protein|nr:MAG: hypothetical protein DIU62_07180 [Pseudomonadota bacterium]
MESIDGIRNGRARPLAAALACLMTSFIFTSVTLVFTAGGMAGRTPVVAQGANPMALSGA